MSHLSREQVLWLMTLEGEAVHVMLIGIMEGKSGWQC